MNRIGDASVYSWDDGAVGSGNALQRSAGAGCRFLRCHKNFAAARARLPSFRLQNTGLRRGVCSDQQYPAAFCSLSSRSSCPKAAATRTFDWISEYNRLRSFAAFAFRSPQSINS